jgi:hypothetical protein
MTKTGANTRRGLRALLALLALVAASLTALAAGASPAAAAQPCWKQVLNDWFVDGRIDGTYPIHCYSDAEKHIGEDAKQYSTFSQDAQRAMLAAIRHQDNGGGSNSSGGGTSGPSAGGGSGNSSSGGGTTPSATKRAHKGPFTRAIEWLGPSNADSIPLPLLVLGGIALLLLAGAAASWFARRYQARRLRPVPQPQQPPEQP